MSKQTTDCQGPALNQTERKRWVELYDKYPRARQENQELRALTLKMSRKLCAEGTCVWCG